MRKFTIAEKIIKLSISGLPSSSLVVEDSYVKAIINGAKAGLLAAFIIIMLVIILLLW